MSIFASETQKTIAIPFDEPHTITIRKLTGREVERAQEVDALGMVKGTARTWAARLKQMATTGDPKAMETLSDPLIGYDRFSIIRSGLMAWSYPQAIRVEHKRLGDPEVDAIDDLDDEAVEFIAREILRLTKPALFQTREDAKAAQKESEAAPSIA